MMESPVQCGCNAHAAPGFFLWPTSRKSLSCHESPACRRVNSKKIVQNLEELSIDFVRFLE